MDVTRVDVLKIRAERAKDKGRDFDIDAETALPDVGAFGYLVAAMFDLGPTRAAGMGDAPTDYPVIEAFARSTGKIDMGWDVGTLYRMCCAFHRERGEGEDPFSKPPVERG